MIISTLIISCLVLVAVGVGIFLNFQSYRNTLVAIANFQESITSKIQDLESKIVLNLQHLNDSTHAVADLTKSEIQASVKDNSTLLHEKLTAKWQESDRHHIDAVKSATKSLSELIESMGTEVKEITQSALQSLKNETENNIKASSAAINGKVDTALKAHETQQTQLVEDVTEKFDKIISEIRSPLTLD